jgi:hypothetical protein
MPSTTNSASWDFNPSDPVHLSAIFSFDTEDTQDAAPVAAATAAIQARGDDHRHCHHLTQALWKNGPKERLEVIQEAPWAAPKRKRST